MVTAAIFATAEPASRARPAAEQLLAAARVARRPTSGYAPTVSGSLPVAPGL
jgi:hypothetical protein